jgi:ADP-ribose pyrophosphatase YjhB (NUDIX family)
MKNHHIKLHVYQKQLLAKLVSVQKVAFKDLQLEGLESEHMNYHLKKLVEAGLVYKGKDGYSLTNEGKDYSNLMDDEVEFVEKQPKTSVLLNIIRINDQGKKEELMCKRLRQPYYGKVGRLTGKVRFGEKLEEAAARELYEETGLKANTIVLEEIYHKIRKDRDGNPIQDVLFYRFFITDVFGSFIPKTPHQENIWIGSENGSLEDFDFFDDLEFNEKKEPRKLTFVEHSKTDDGSF